MVRESGWPAVVIAALCPGCSLILDFSNSAAPKDAALDAPYTQAECDFGEPNDTPAMATSIMPGDTGPAAICATGGTEDVDYYTFNVTGATSVTVGIQFTNRPTGDLDIKLFSANDTGTPIAQSRGFGDGETILCPGSSPACPTLGDGDYLLEVFPAITGAVNSYTFSVQIQ